MRTLRFHVEVDFPNSVADKLDEEGFEVDVETLQVMSFKGRDGYLTRGELSNIKWKRGHKPDDLFD